MLYTALPSFAKGSFLKSFNKLIINLGNNFNLKLISKLNFEGSMEMNFFP